MLFDAGSRSFKSAQVRSNRPGLSRFRRFSDNSRNSLSGAPRRTRTFLLYSARLADFAHFLRFVRFRAPFALCVHFPARSHSRRLFFTFSRFLNTLQKLSGLARTTNESPRTPARSPIN